MYKISHKTLKSCRKHVFDYKALLLELLRVARSDKDAKDITKKLSKVEKTLFKLNDYFL